jgi:dipeptidyl aminopeptidase/acylaminoacyl peptidase
MKTQYPNITLIRKKLMKISKILTLTLLVWSSFAACKILPLEDFIKPAEFITIKISPDGSKMVGVIRENDRDKVAVIDIKTMKPLSAKEFGESRVVRGVTWANNDTILMSVTKSVGYLDRKGKWDGVYAMKFDGKKSKPLFNRENLYGVDILDGLPESKRKILIRHHNQNYYYDLKSNKKSFMSRPADKYASAPSLNKKYQPVVAIGYNIKTESTYLHYKKGDAKSWTKLDLAQGKKEVSTSFGGNSSDPNIVYILSNHDASTIGLFKLNLSSGNLTNIYRNDEVDIAGRIENADNETIGFTLMPGYPEVIWVNKKDSITKTYKGLKQSFPGQNIRIFNFTLDNKQMVFNVSSDRNPGQFFLLNLTTNKIKPLVKGRSWIDPKDMSEMKPITITARDGLKLHGYLTLPNGKEPKNLPLVVNPHGGPHGPRDSWGFNPEVQLMANRGYAVLQLDYRGSGGYGRDFQMAGYRKWGREMQDDLTDATLWAVNQGIADRDRLCIYGGSYGGYATLQGLVREPDLYKCGIGYVGVYDLKVWKHCSDTVSKGGSRGQKYLTKVHGKDKKELEAYSPAYNTDKIKAKVFLAHGEDDVRVPMCQLNSLVKGLKKSGVDYEVMTRDEGHGYHDPQNRKDFYSRLLSFLDENIGH